MASPRIDSVPPKLSFAKVAAMNVPSPLSSKNNSDEERFHPPPQSHRRSTMVRDRPKSPQLPGENVSTAPDRDVQAGSAESNELREQLHSAIRIRPLPIELNGPKSNESGDSLEDDQSQLSNSSTKQHSFETKSVASVTTFAMDEKESIRPDDSASVRAVDDEEAGSVVSRNPVGQSESSVIMPPLRNTSSRPSVTGISITFRRFHTLTNPPRFGTLEGPPQAEPESADLATPSTTNDSQEDPRGRTSSVPASPDEKLLDALASPKDRLSILQLEEKVLAFIAQPALPFFDLPPQNSYARLLSHKLADYYNLMHQINEDGQSIRIFRTSLGALPTSLAALAKSIPVASAQPLGPTAVKIMRRAGVGPRQFSAADSTAPSSSAPSKTTSEAGHSEEGLISPIEGTPSRDKSRLTREEREAMYKAARERIFGDFQELSIAENTSTGENSADMSRSSSSSGKKKSRRQKAPKDDSFEARSAYVASYGPVHGVPVQGAYQPAQFIDQNYQSQYDNSFSPSGSQMHYGSQPTQNYPAFDQHGQVSSPMSFNATSPSSYMPPEQWSTMQAQSQNSHYPYPQSQFAYQQNMQSMLAPVSNQFLPPISPQMQQQQSSWSNQQFSAPYQQQVGHQMTTGWSNYQSQQYGQMSNQTYQPHAPVQVPSPAPTPSTYNRTLFNPQTRSFVPSTGSSRSNSRQTGRKKGSPNSGANHQSQYNPNGGSNLHSVNMGPVASPHTPKPQGAYPQPALSTLANPGVEESLTKKYGALANLPKKPPPSQVPRQFDGLILQGSMRSSSGSVPTINGSGGRSEAADSSA